MVAGRAAAGTPGDVYWTRFKTDVETASSGRLSARLIIRGELGPEETLLRGLRRNTIQLGGISTSSLSLVLPELGVFRLPFLFESDEELAYVLASPVRDHVRARLSDRGLEMMGWMSAGWLNVFATQPLISPSDLTQNRLRVSVDQAAQAYMTELNADTAQIPFSDILQGLQTGLITGGEQSTQLFVIGGFSVVAPHLTKTRHAYVLAIVVANGDWLNGMPLQDQSIYRNAVPDDAWYRDLFNAEDAMALERAKASGLSVYELSEDQRRAWRAPADAAARRYLDEAGPDAVVLYDMIQEAKAAFRGR